MLEEGEVPNKKYTQLTQPPKFNIKSTSYRTKVCDHFKKGACLKGNKCSYMHPKELQNVLRICKYFLGQGCSNQQCQFSHDLSKYQCKFYFAMGNCKEQTCRFSHDKWENETAKLQWASDNDQFLKDCLQKRGTTGLGPNYDEQYRMKLMDQQFKFMRPPQQQYYQIPQMQSVFQQIQPHEPLEQISDDEQSEEDNKQQYPQVPVQIPYQQFNPYQYSYFQPPIWSQKQQVLLQQQQQQQMQFNQQQSLYTSQFQQPQYEPQQQVVQKQEPIYKLEPLPTYKLEPQQEPEPPKTKKIKKPKKKRRETIKQLKERMKKQKQQKTIKLPVDPIPETYKPGVLSVHLGIPIRKPVAQFFLGF